MNTDLNLWMALLILFLHFLGDFVFQSNTIAKDKSKNWAALMAHTYIYTATFAVPAILYCLLVARSLAFLDQFAPFFIITLFCHTLQDYVTSRINTRLWKNDRTHAFWCSVGFDQFLHFVQLLITYSLLS